MTPMKSIGLQCVIALLAGADAHDVFDIGHEDLAVADVAGMQHALGSFNDHAYRDLADHDVHLHLGQQRDLHWRASVVFRLALACRSP